MFKFILLVSTMLILTGCGADNGAPLDEANVSPTATVREASGGEDHAVAKTPAVEATATGTSTPIDLETPPDDHQRWRESYVRYTAKGTEYTNNRGRFTVVFPGSWGVIKETLVDEPYEAKIFYSVRLSSSSDEQRYFTVQMVNMEDVTNPFVVDYPHTFLTDALGLGYFYVAAGDHAGAPGLEDEKHEDLARESEAIAKTFQTW